MSSSPLSLLRHELQKLDTAITKLELKLIKNKREEAIYTSPPRVTLPSELPTDKEVQM